MTFEELKTIIESVVQEKVVIEPESILTDDLGITSFEMMVIIVKIEDEYKFQVDLSRVRKGMSVKDLLSIVYKVGEG